MLILAVKYPYIPYQPFACVYRLNLGQGFFYIGATTDLEKRIDNHASNIKTGRRDIKPYTTMLTSKHTISVEIIEEVTDLTQLVPREQFYIDKYINEFRCVNLAKTSVLTFKLKQFCETV